MSANESPRGNIKLMPAVTRSQDDTWQVVLSPGFPGCGCACSQEHRTGCAQGCCKPHPKPHPFCWQTGIPTLPAGWAVYYLPSASYLKLFLVGWGHLQAGAQAESWGTEWMGRGTHLRSLSRSRSLAQDSACSSRSGTVSSSRHISSITPRSPSPDRHRVF